MTKLFKLILSEPETVLFPLIHNLEKIMKKTYIRWILAIVITLAAAVYQRMTGPTYPLRGKAMIDGQDISYRLSRSHGGEGDQPISIAFADTSYSAQLVYKRYKVDENWTPVPMKIEDGKFTGYLPHQPAAGKLEYFIKLHKSGKNILIPADRTVVTRFKGHVPELALLPHILLMFIAMLLSSMTALEALVRGDRVYLYTIITTISLFIGGMILGPVVQKFAFGEYWTGVPFGYDLTDNKTLIAMIGWLIPFVQIIRNRDSNAARWWIVVAAVILLLVFSIPHSVMGSEFDYEKMQIIQGN